MSEYTPISVETGEPPFAATIAAARVQCMPPLALLYSDETLLAHVETALDEMGAAVVYRAPHGATEQDALLAARPAITLINLDDRCDDRLDQVTAWLDAAQVPVVFNDADISRSLEGWARARWARHLAAKLRGSEDVDPPRPVQAVRAQEPVQETTQPESVADVAPQFDHDTTEFTSIVPIASRPLTPGEIESLVADFPSEQQMPTEDATEAMSAQVDALLAEQPDGAASTEPAPWDAIPPLEDVPVAAASTAAPPSTPAVAAAPTIPSFASWQLVDDVEPVASAPREKPAEATPAPRIEFDFELEPLEASVPAALVREREVQEMRLDRIAAKPAGASE